MSDFEVGASYTRAQIGEILVGLGSGPLPEQEGIIQCGLFDLSKNAVTHFSGGIDLFVKRVPKNLGPLYDRPLPIFLKVSTQLWRFAGAYHLEKTDRSRAALEEGHRVTGGEVAALLRFSPSRE